LRLEEQKRRTAKGEKASDSLGEKPQRRDPTKAVQKKIENKSPNEKGGARDKGGMGYPKRECLLQPPQRQLASNQACRGKKPKGCRERRERSTVEVPLEEPMNRPTSTKASMSNGQSEG